MAAATAAANEADDEFLPVTGGQRAAGLESGARHEAGGEFQKRATIGVMMRHGRISSANSGVIGNRSDPTNTSLR